MDLQSAKGNLVVHQMLVNKGRANLSSRLKCSATSRWVVLTTTTICFTHLSNQQEIYRKGDSRIFPSQLPIYRKGEADVGFSGSPSLAGTEWVCDWWTRPLDAAVASREHCQMAPRWRSGGGFPLPCRSQGWFLCFSCAHAPILFICKHMWTWLLGGKQPGTKFPAKDYHLS